MKNAFEEVPEELTSKERERKRKIGKDKKMHDVEHAVLKKIGGEHKGPIKKPLEWVNEKFGEGWLERRGELMAERSGIGQAINEIDEQEITVIDIGSGKQHINEAIKNSSDKDIKVIGFDESDRATKKVSESDREKNIGSARAIGEKLPIKDGEADVVKFDFTFQEADDKMTEELLQEAKRVLKNDGMITVIEDLSQEKFINEQSAEIKSELRNRRSVKLNLRSDEELQQLFEDNDLEVVGKPTVFGEDEENKKEQFISYVLKKVEAEEVE